MAPGGKWVSSSISSPCPWGLGREAAQAACGSLLSQVLESGLDGVSGGLPGIKAAQKRVYLAVVETLIDG